MNVVSAPFFPFVFFIVIVSEERKFDLKAQGNSAIGTFVADTVRHVVR